MLKGKFIPKFGGPSILFNVPCIDCVIKTKEISITNHTTEREHMWTLLMHRTTKCDFVFIQKYLIDEEENLSKIYA